MKLRIVHDKYLGRYFVEKRFLFFWWITPNPSGGWISEYYKQAKNGFKTLEAAVEYERWYFDEQLKILQSKHQDKINRNDKNRKSIIRQDNINLAYLYFEKPNQNN
jgi:hypothetical protein